MDWEFHDPYDILVDAIINAVRKRRVQEGLLDKREDLTLAQALQFRQQDEFSQKQMKIVHNKEAPIAAITQSQKPATLKSLRRSGNHPSSAQSQTPAVNNAGPPTCWRCGKGAEHQWNGRNVLRPGPRALTARNQDTGCLCTKSAPPACCNCRTGASDRRKPPQHQYAAPAAGKLVNYQATERSCFVLTQRIGAMSLKLLTTKICNIEESSGNQPTYSEPFLITRSSQ